MKTFLFNKEGKDNDLKSYTLDQIKKAFWVNFHKSGEIWLNYLGTDEENESSTQSLWEEFIELLDKIK